MDCFERLEANLRRHRVPFAVQYHPLAYTAQDVAASEHISGNVVAKVVMVLADDRLVMLVLPASRRVDEGKAATALHARKVRLADEHEFSHIFKDCDVGAMPPFGNLYGVPVYVDTALAEDDVIVFQAGTHTETMSVRFADYKRLVKPVVADLAVAELVRHA